VLADNAPSMVRVVYHITNYSRGGGTNASEKRIVCIAGVYYFRLQVSVNDTIRYAAIKNHRKLYEFDFATKGRLDHDLDSDSVRVLFFDPPESPIFQQLAVGREVEYFEKHHARRAGRVAVDSVLCDRQVLLDGSDSLCLWTRMDNLQPFKLSIGSRYSDYSIRFDSYKANLVFDSILFDPTAKLTGPK
jgi:hypothetical protein